MAISDAPQNWEMGKKDGPVQDIIGYQEQLAFPVGQYTSVNVRWYMENPY